MTENEITFNEFWALLTRCNRIDVTETPNTASIWDRQRIEAYILNIEQSGSKELRYFKSPFESPFLEIEVQLKGKRVFLFKIS